MAHSTAEELKLKIDEVKSKLEIGGIYFHHSNPDHHYKVIDVVMMEATDEPGVLYQPLYDGYEFFMWCRNAKDFLSTLEKNGKVINKFTLVQ